jgi:hypothetical protein
MDRIHYAGNSVLTGTAIAQALLEYAKALGMRNEAATVEIPVRHPDGRVGRAEFLIGPASQLVTEDEPSDLEELIDEDVVEGFRRRTVELLPSRPVTDDRELLPTDQGFDEL